MKKSNITIFIIISTLLSSCASNKSAKMVQKIRSEMKTVHGIKDGEIIAKFDLESLDPKTKSKLFWENYGNIINNSENTSRFLSDFSKSYRHKDYIESNSYKKLSQLSSLLVQIDAKAKLLNQHIKLKIKKAYAILKKHKSSNDLVNINHPIQSNLKAANQPIKDTCFDMLAELHNATKTIPLYPPLAKPIVTSKFGKRLHPHKKQYIHHNGLDLAGPKHCKIYAAADGIVEAIGRTETFGNIITIRHDTKIKTRYAHLNKIAVKTGDKVLLGQNLGSQGCSGTATGHHLHFEIIVGGKALDPLNFLSTSL